MIAVVAMAVPGLMHAQGTTPKEKPSDYPVHAAVGRATIAAENMGHSIAAPGGMLFAGDYLVIEVAFYSDSKEPLALAAGQFKLRLNGRKTLIFPQSAGMVAASIKYPDWEQRPNLTVAGSAGNAGVIVGQPRATERFPGDRRAPENRLPQPPRAPDQDHTGLDKAPAPSTGEIVQRAALPEGEVKLPAGGLLYFPYKGKLSTLKSVELIYEGPSGGATLRLP